MSKNKITINILQTEARLMGYFNLDEINNAIVLADFEKDIENLPHGLDTVVGEYGVTLSGGQKQRVSIARALIKDPSILIFDDSVSAVDTKTEETILSNLRRLRTGKTTIMIAHRISTVETLDKIVLVDDGKILVNGKQEKGKIYYAKVSLDGNPNDSMYAIEGITSPDGRVFGKMGHSERIGNGLYKNVYGEYDIKMFSSAVKYFK